MVAVSGPYRLEKPWFEVVGDIIVTFTLLPSDLREDFLVMVDKELVPKQKTDHAPPRYVSGPFARVFGALRCKASKQREINVRIRQFLEQRLNGRRTGGDEALKR